MLATRRDTPTLYVPKRAAKSAVIETASNPVLLAEAKQRMFADIHSHNSLGPLNSYANAWQTFHDAAFNTNLEPNSPEWTDMIPLTIDKIFTVASLFKVGQYKSYCNYLQAVKEIHLRDHEWSTRLAKAAKDSIRSVSRGLGPAKQAAAFDLNKVFTLPDTVEPLVLHGPILAINMTIIGSFFILREIEISLALARSVTVDYTTQRICWNLPASKTDPKGLGKTRSWGCTCNGFLNTPCPFHAAAKRMECLHELFAIDGELPADLPFCPQIDGSVVDKENVVRTFEHIAKLLGLAIRSPDDQRLWGGHSLRVTGAQHLAELGVELVVIALLARWASAIVLRYAAEAPLLNITDTYKQKMQAFKLQSFITQVRQEMQEERDTMKRLHIDYVEAIKQEMELSKPQETPRSTQEKTDSERCIPSTATHPTHVINDETNVIHKAWICEISAQPITWSTRCGWKFGCSIHTPLFGMPTSYPWRNICKKCLPDERSSYQDEQLGNDSPSSASSSSSSGSDD